MKLKLTRGAFYCYIKSMLKHIMSNKIVNRLMIFNNNQIYKFENFVYNCYAYHQHKENFLVFNLSFISKIKKNTVNISETEKSAFRMTHLLLLCIY